jgi:hypothetical protein
MGTEGETTSRKKLILAGVAVAVPLAAVALYFALLDQPGPPTRSAQPPPPTAAPSGQGGPPGPTALPPDHPPIGGPPEGGQPGAEQAQAGPLPAGAHPQVGAGRPIRVPDVVKGKWQAVKLRVEEKAGGKAPQLFTVALGGQLNVPGSKLRLKVGEFLPALQVSGGEITSASNDPVNPAALVTVSEGGRESFKGWLFSKFPDMQPFEHPKYRITLVEGIPKS